MDTEIRVKKGEPIERALRRLKKKLDKEGTLKDLRNRRHYFAKSGAFPLRIFTFSGFTSTWLKKLFHIKEW